MQELSADTQDKDEGFLVKSLCIGVKIIGFFLLLTHTGKHVYHINVWLYINIG